MKKNGKIRLTLNRETLRTLDANDLTAAPGGVNSQPFCQITYYTCRVSCGGTCDVYCVAPTTSLTC
jgi:hypothetical protein